MQNSQSPFLVNIVPLANVQTNISGIDALAKVTTSVGNIQQMVNTDTKTIFANSLASYTNGGSIQVQSPLNLNNGITGTTLNTVVMSTIGVSTFLTVSSNIQMGVDGQQILSIQSNSVLLTKATEFRVSSMNTYLDALYVSSMVGGNCFAQSFVTLSDESSKTDICRLSTIQLSNIHPYRFKYLGNDTDDIGLLAQELEGVYPECIVEHGSTKYVKYNSVISLLLGTLHQLEERVRVLETKINQSDM
jgi:hypothetical protein